MVFADVYFVSIATIISGKFWGLGCWLRDFGEKLLKTLY
jgi:hypothetical protein